MRGLALRCDLVLVVGSPNSSNTSRLVEVARREGCRSELLEDASELQLEWLDGARIVGRDRRGVSTRVSVRRSSMRSRPSGH